MKKAVLKYGLMGGFFICTLFLLSWFLGSGLDYATQEVLGYASMIVALSVVFFGIRHYRDRLNSGALSFGTGLRIGLGISLITAILFGILDVIYVRYLNPDFMDSYYTTLLADLESSLPEAEYQQRVTELGAERELFSNPLVNFLIMAVTVLLIGFMISLLSALYLKRKPPAMPS